MGLDMYLTKRIYVGAEYDFNKIKGSVRIKKEGRKIPINFKKITYINQNVIYWRKANYIHNWFVQNCQKGVDECQETWIPFEKLKELFEICDKVIKNHKKASELLPTCKGFFFGAEEYDSYYFDYIKETRKELKKILKEYETIKDLHVIEYYYQEAW